MYRAVLAVSVLAASALPAAAQQAQTQAQEQPQVQLSWVTTETENGATFAFGTAEADNTVLSILCERGNPTVLITSTITPKGLKADEQAKITFTAGKVRKELAGKGVASEDGAVVDLEVGAKLDDVKALVSGGKILVLETKGVKQQVALLGAGDAYTQFENLCKAK